MIIGILVLLGLISLVILWSICRVASDADTTTEWNEKKFDKDDKTEK